MQGRAGRGVCCELCSRWRNLRILTLFRFDEMVQEGNVLPGEGEGEGTQVVVWKRGMGGGDRGGKGGRKGGGTGERGV